MTRRSSAPRTSWVLLLVLVAALATGAAASILVSASTAPPPASGPAPLVILPQSVLAAVAVGFLFFVIGVVIYMRVTSTHTVSMNRPAVVGLVLILLGILFVVVVRLTGFGGALPSLSSGGSGGNGSSSGSTGNGGGNVTGPGGHLVLFPNLPAWLPFALVAVVAVIVLLVAVPEVRRYLAERGPSKGPTRAKGEAVPAGVREALTRASAELDLGGDPRLVILALYTELLGRLESIVGDVGTSTPEEIRADHLVRLGVRPAAAESLTRLFEEARYSTHAMGPNESARAREAVRTTLDDLARRNFPT